MGRRAERPIVLVKWYDVLKWLLERIDNFPKSQRFIFGQRLADHGIEVLELLVEAAYSSRKVLLTNTGRVRHDADDAMVSPHRLSSHLAASGRRHDTAAACSCQRPMLAPPSEPPAVPPLRWGGKR